MERKHIMERRTNRTDYRNHVYLTTAGIALLFLLGGFAANPVAADSPDYTAPAISDVHVTNITYEDATISWVTNEPATSQIEYDSDLTYGETTPLDSSMVSDHFITLNNLHNGKDYHFRVKSIDSAGNVSISPNTEFVTDTAPRMLGIPRHSRCSCHH
jgi:hypothetical protein